MLLRGCLGFIHVLCVGRVKWQSVGMSQEVTWRNVCASLPMCRAQPVLQADTEIHLLWKHAQEYSQNRWGKTALSALLPLPLSTSPAWACSGEKEVIFTRMCTGCCGVIPAGSRCLVRLQLHSVLSHQVRFCSPAKTHPASFPLPTARQHLEGSWESKGRGGLGSQVNAGIWQVGAERLSELAGEASGGRASSSSPWGLSRILSHQTLTLGTKFLHFRGDRKLISSFQWEPHTDVFAFYCSFNLQI